MNHRIRLLVVFVLGLILAGCNMPLSDDQIAGTLAITPPQPTKESSFIPAHISGRVWHDLCAAPSGDQPMPDEPPEGCVPNDGNFHADGIYDPSEPGIMNVIARLGKGVCPSTGFADSTTNSEGVFNFVDLEAGDYCLAVDPSHPQNSQILAPGKWTSDLGAGSGPIAITVSLEPDEAVTHFEFGWDYQFQPPYVTPPTETPESTEILSTSIPSETPDVTDTPQTTDPFLPTGAPDYRDLMINPGNWFSGVSSWEDEHVRFEIDNGRMNMTAFNPDLYEGWRLSWPDIEDFYLEIFFETGECTGRDRYGIFVRGTNISDNPYGYLFGVTCDGQYSLRAFEGEFTTLISWTPSNHISSGSNQSNRLGFWAKGNQLKLYVNGERLAEFEDDTFDAGPFGLFIGSAETQDFIVEALEIAYWLLP